MLLAQSRGHDELYIKIYSVNSKSISTVFSFPLFVGELKKHSEIKDKVLSSINNEASYERLIFENEKTDITRCDWTIPREIKRDYLFDVMPEIYKYMEDLVYKVGYDAYTIHNVWFQQYEKNSSHNWHVHVDCQWTNVYYLELPDNAPKPQFLIPWENNKVIDLNVCEGQVITFPSMVIHRSPIVNDDTRKTIISYNCDFNITEKIIQEKYNV